MTTDNFTTASQELINQSATIATELHNPELTPLHTLAAGLQNEFCLSFFNIADLSTQELAQLVKKELNLLPKSKGTDLSISSSMQQFFQACKKEADKFGDISS